nr:putative zinc finger, CCHC-type [Tanacetum cinerariifolium]
MMLAAKDEARVNLDTKENDFMLMNAYGDDQLEELNASVITIVRIQPTNNKSDAEPNYDDEVNSEDYSGQPEHDKDAHDQTYADIESMIYNVQVEAENQCRMNNELKKQNALIQRELETCKERVQNFKKKPVQFINYKFGYEKLKNQISIEKQTIEKLKKEKDEIQNQFLKARDESLNIQNETEYFKNAFKMKEDKYLDDIVMLGENFKSHEQVVFKMLGEIFKSHEQVVFKMSHSLQTIHMLGTIPNLFYDPNMKTGLGYQNPKRLKKAIKAQPKMYNDKNLKYAKLTVNLPEYVETLSVEQPHHPSTATIAAQCLNRGAFGCNVTKRVRLVCFKPEKGVCFGGQLAVRVRLVLITPTGCILFDKSTKVRMVLHQQGACGFLNTRQQRGRLDMRLTAANEGVWFGVLRPSRGVWRFDSHLRRFDHLISCDLIIDIYVGGSKNRHLMLNKDNYVPWSSHLLRYAKSKPNEKLLVNSIIHGRYVRRIIVELGDPDRETHVAESSHEQTDNELTKKEAKMQEIRFGRMHGRLQGIKIEIANQNRNGNVVAARAEGNGNKNNENQIRCYNCRGVGDYEEIKKVNANYILMANLQQASTLGTQNDIAPIYETDRSTEALHCVLPNLKTNTAFILGGTLPNLFLDCILSKALHCDLLPAFCLLLKTIIEFWGKENVVNILQSIDNGPYQMGTTRDTLGTANDGDVTFRINRPRTYNDLDEHEKKRFDAYIQATNIVLQGLPKDIYKLINHNTEAKAIWDNVKMLLAGSELTKDRESQLYDEFKRFKMIPGENITDYYVRFHKLVNDMRNIKMTMSNIQLNSKFVNNMTPEWDRAGNANQGQGKPIKCYNCGGFRHIARNYTQPMHPQNSDYFKEKMLLMQAQENKAVLDKEELLFLACEQANTYDADVDDLPVHDMAQNDPNIFQVDDYDAFDSDFDDEPIAQTIFMANLSSAVSSLQQAGPSNASILFEALNMENTINHHEIPNNDNEESVVPIGASFVEYDNYMLHENSDYVPDNSFTMTLNIYKDHVAIYEQRAKFELIDRKQRMDDQMRMLIQERSSKTLITKVKEMKEIFKSMEAEVDQNAIDLKSGEIERKNLLITNENLIAKCIAQDVFYTVTNSALTASQFHELSIAYNVAQTRAVKQPNKPKTNVPVIPSIGVNSATKASRSQPRSNTKIDGTLTAKSRHKKNVEDHLRNNKYDLHKKNRVDSGIS